MKLERLHEYILPTVVTLGGMGLAIYCGRLTGYGQMSTLSTIIFAIVTTIVILTMKTKVWIIIPLAWSLFGSIPVLPLPFSVRHLAILAVFAVFLAFRALKALREPRKFDLLDLLLLVNLLYLATAFMRNPVGTYATGSARVGGRPYFDIFVGFLACLVLGRVATTVQGIRRVPLLVMSSSWIQGMIAGLTYHFAGLVPVISQFYTGVTTETYNIQDIRVGGEGSGRRTYLYQIGQPITLWMVAWFRPLTLISPVFFWRTALFSIACILLLYAGFRSAILALIFAFLVSSYIRRGIMEVFRIVMVGIPIIAIVVMMQGRVFNLPHSVQRALSFLPGQWSETAVRDAEGSTEWRVQMWKIMLTETKYIHNRWLGDGFGFSLGDFNLIQAMEAGRHGDSQESTMVLGTVHSGPLSAVRYVGLVGLVLYMTLTVTLAVRAYRFVVQAKETPFFEPALFLCIPIMYDPILYVFIFGGLDSAYPTSLYFLGLFRMLSNSYEDYVRDRGREGHVKTLEQKWEQRALAETPRTLLLGTR